MTSPLHFVGLSECHLGHLIGVGANLELADLKNWHWSNELKEQSLLIYLSIQRKVVKPHGTDEVDVGGLRVHYLFISRDPQTRVLWQHLHNLHSLLDNEDSNNIRHLEGLEVVDEDVGQPELFDQL